MAKIDSTLNERLNTNPDQFLDLIVRTQGDATPHLAWLDSAGIEVRQQYRLSPGVAVTCSGRNVQRLLAQEWVVSIEIDSPITAL
jgi:hypothetical protein